VLFVLRSDGDGCRECAGLGGVERDLRKMSISSFIMSAGTARYVGGEFGSGVTRMSMTPPHSWRATAANHALSDIRTTRGSCLFSVATVLNEIRSRGTSASSVNSFCAMSSAV
jgi:hypothetical protein